MLQTQVIKSFHFDTIYIMGNLTLSEDELKVLVTILEKLYFKPQDAKVISAIIDKLREGITTTLPAPVSFKDFSSIEIETRAKVK